MGFIIKLNGWYNTWESNLKVNAKYMPSKLHVSLSELRELVMDKEAWRAAIHGVAKSRIWLRNWTELKLLYNFPEWCLSLKSNSSHTG